MFILMSIDQLLNLMALSRSYSTVGNPGCILQLPGISSCPQSTSSFVIESLNIFFFFSCYESNSINIFSLAFFGSNLDVKNMFVWRSCKIQSKYLGFAQQFSYGFLDNIVHFSHYILFTFFLFQIIYIIIYAFNTVIAYLSISYISRSCIIFSGCVSSIVVRGSVREIGILNSNSGQIN